MIDLNDDSNLIEEFNSIDKIIDSIDESLKDESEVKNQLSILKVYFQSLKEKCFPPAREQPNFYPAIGTVFIETGLNLPCVIEKKDALFANSAFGVSYNDQERGICEYPNWLDGVRSNRICLVWCPKMGKIISNEDWLVFWGLI